MSAVHIGPEAFVITQSVLLTKNVPPIVKVAHGSLERSSTAMPSSVSVTSPTISRNTLNSFADDVRQASRLKW